MNSDLELMIDMYIKKQRKAGKIPTFSGYLLTLTKGERKEVSQYNEYYEEVFASRFSA